MILLCNWQTVQIIIVTFNIYKYKILNKSSIITRLDEIDERLIGNDCARLIVDKCI